MFNRTLWIVVLIVISAFYTNIINANSNDPNGKLNERVDNVQMEHQYDGYESELKAVATGTCPIELSKICESHDRQHRQTNLSVQRQMGK